MINTVLISGYVSSYPVESGSDQQIYYDRYVQCLVKTNNQKKAVKFIRKKSKKQPDPLNYMVDECWVLSTDKNTENESKKLFDFI